MHDVLPRVQPRVFFFTVNHVYVRRSDYATGSVQYASACVLRRRVVQPVPENVCYEYDIERIFLSVIYMYIIRSDMERYRNGYLQHYILRQSTSSNFNRTILLQIVDIILINYICQKQLLINDIYCYPDSIRLSPKRTFHSKCFVAFIGVIKREGNTNKIIYKSIYWVSYVLYVYE